MGYNQDRKNVLNESNSLGLRHVSLLNCIRRFSWLTKCGFRNELRHLYYICNFRKGEINSAKTFVEAQYEIDRQREIFLKKQYKFSEKRKTQKKKGRRTPPKKQLDELYFKEEFLDHRAIKDSYQEVG